jgi:hypothetical protein
MGQRVWDVKLTTQPPSGVEVTCIEAVPLLLHMSSRHVALMEHGTLLLVEDLYLPEHDTL